MNYRHGFHAGNFADVLKHIVLLAIIAYLKRKDAPFRVIDTHAGAGFYDLSGEEAQRTGEWRDGIARIRKGGFPQSVRPLIEAYLEAVGPDKLHYPGSPLLIRKALRAQDRACVNELHGPTQAELRSHLRRDERFAITGIDAYMAWKAQLPPVERRGLVLVDPPFEKTDDFARIADGLAMMGQKWPTGTAMIWYPIKDKAAIGAMEDAAIATALPKVLVAELHVAEAERVGPLAACGLLIANPPFTLEAELAELLPVLASRLARQDHTGSTGRWRLEHLKGE